MNEEAIVELKRILAKEPRELTAHDIAFLKARWPYVGKKSRERFHDLIEGKGQVSDKAEKESKQVESQEVEEQKKDETVEVEQDKPSNPFETVDQDEEE